MSNLSEILAFTNNSPQASTKEEIQLVHNGTPQIFGLNSSQINKSKGVIVINPGLATRHLHLKKPFIGYQLAELGYAVFVINTLDLSLYGMNEADPFHRPHLTSKAYSLIEKLVGNSKIISLGHSLGCIDLLRTKPKLSKAVIFISPAFKGDNKRFSPIIFVKFLKSFFNGNFVDLKVHGNSCKPELSEFKTDFVSARFLWNLQKYARGLENTELWPLERPIFTWLGSNGSSDGLIETKQVYKWVNSMQLSTSKLKFAIHKEAGHEPGWKAPQHSIALAKEIDTWIQEYVL